ncbi:alpha/beta fold hydrolase [Amycolatopsis rhabdoformis]|uniref:Alpha/beta fold hydrolase n=1 Tax=Amycolatopsis rhabdoformis TaxID=1448059 RepID=A0ABZ1IG79_9PSEU|nr:alpha/beta fold hydrolase [Amycolatopsis rhabdoformis]WSE33480.1 alpha/beta fold hydrolase [Amycolatopsis rhabdoformis]
MGMIEAAGARFGYDEAGNGPAVVLLHAGIADRRMWDRQFAALARHHRVIRYDRRGHGESVPVEGTVSHHHDLLAVMSALGVDRAALVGSSMGGAYALDAALAAPDRVESLALIGSGLSGHEWPEPMASDSREAMLAAVPVEDLKRYLDHTADHVDEAHVRAVAEANVRYLVVGPHRTPDAVDPRFYVQALEMCADVYRREWTEPKWTEDVPDTRHRLGEITAPTLVLIGLEDGSGLLELADRFTTEIPGARRLDLPDTGHLPPLERPAEVTEALQDWLRKPT